MGDDRREPVAVGYRMEKGGEIDGVVIVVSSKCGQTKWIPLSELPPMGSLEQPGDRPTIVAGDVRHLETMVLQEIPSQEGQKD
jgi:hypothetical protein